MRASESNIHLPQVSLTVRTRLVRNVLATSIPSTIILLRMRRKGRRCSNKKRTRRIFHPMSSVFDRLKALGLDLPDAPKPVAAYVPAVRTGNLIIVSGQIPLRNGSVAWTGPVPSAQSVQDATDAARQCVLNGLAVVASMLDGDLEKVRRIVRVGVFVQSDAGFADQPKVANGASELLQDVFGEAGRHARAAVGSVGLPLNATVEVEMMVEVAG